MDLAFNTTEWGRAPSCHLIDLYTTITRFSQEWWSEWTGRAK